MAMAAAIAGMSASARKARMGVGEFCLIIVIRFLSLELFSEFVSKEYLMPVARSTRSC